MRGTRILTPADRPAAPDGLPLLVAGRHVRPADGACFMEFASVLAGERFSDHPRCTHALLAALARAVNDTVDDATRQQLLPLVPTVIGVRRPHALLSAATVVTMTGRALLVAPDSAQLRAAHTRAKRRLAARRGPARWWVAVSDAAYWRGGGLDAVERSVRTVAAAGPTALRHLLAATVGAATIASTSRSVSSGPRDSAVVAP